jgi:hypothetical protein
MEAVISFIKEFPKQAQSTSHMKALFKRALSMKEVTPKKLSELESLFKT